MAEKVWLAERFEEHRTHLRAVAYRMLGSLAEADDAVQEAWLRASRAGARDVDNLGGWLTTIVARVALNMLRSRNVRREQSYRVHLPDPVVSLEGELRPDQEAMLADSVGLALLVVLDSLGPAERLAFVLHDVFQLPFEEIAPVVGRSPAAARQLASRALRGSVAIVAIRSTSPRHDHQDGRALRPAHVAVAHRPATLAPVKTAPRGEQPDAEVILGSGIGAPEPAPLRALLLRMYTGFSTRPGSDPAADRPQGPASAD